MVVAVLAVRVVQPSFDEIVNVITVGHRFVAAARAMLMRGLVLDRGVPGCAAVRVLALYRNPPHACDRDWRGRRVHARS